ncbi:AQG_2a_G0015560.mRNA.1.CDS.1 [Saccharomyces cerevisiae]|uniref:Protein transport protein YOS1 n=5 Tax=Saccharomyces cerevisiae TaxID=4932 RepID=YOS1_YEAST|nr:Yos1p [Saccharomyces cerevisiae S288C]Q3E834.1 RecName: Full=Protein transport protein YOS1; AltName: Full=YIP one suppressor protein 1 [Saccharomyces cerevisiae S288C]AHY75634.1 Yos1p [Saccharomyces cerevisiae YJM993]AJP38344.1 Yos1p [Saccharomyces cerevisiae YJM1078]AJU40036.1 Yos1p [Saccharomyces cerevisiae YJM693]AJU40291.1 Yos1p [Saccharomyces cerevisiae YJM969]AJU40547.1 Yos1p [Saccharomyces cerevisiae YJM972]AJU40807.1 Yos1p [Saccharomyces cerevisiae YJM975]AJU41065.1 Yos1p [Sacch|eukprot:NP_219496.2 Yos1p [Saccharomyces cerevisiae S288C]
MVLFGLGRLFYVILLLINAVAVLSEERFLRRIGLGRSNDETPVFGQDQNTTKSKVVQLIGAVQTLLRIPLIGINILVIVYELLLG